MEASSAGAERACGAGLLIWDGGVSHLKTQINYSSLTNEQPLGSCISHITNTQSLRESY